MLDTPWTASRAVEHAPGINGIEGRIARRCPVHEPAGHDSRSCRLEAVNLTRLLCGA